MSRLTKIDILLPLVAVGALIFLTGYWVAASNHGASLLQGIHSPLSPLPAPPSSPLPPPPRATSIPDFTPPTTTYQLTGTLGNHGWHLSAVTVTLIAIDNLSGVYFTGYRVDENEKAAYTVPFKTTGEGYHIFTFFSVDHLGNREEIKSGNFAVDLSTPTTTHQLEGSLGLKGWYTSPVTITLSAEDNLSGVATTIYRLDEGDWTVYEGSVSIGEGKHLLDYLSTDLAGNVEPTRTTSLNVDTSPPTTSVQIELVYIGLYPFKVTLTPEDVHSGPDYTLYRSTSLPGPGQPGIEWEIYTAPFYLPDGRYLLEVYSVDQAGNREAIIESTFGPASP